MESEKKGLLERQLGPMTKRIVKDLSGEMGMAVQVDSDGREWLDPEHIIFWNPNVSKNVSVERAIDESLDRLHIAAAKHGACLNPTPVDNGVGGIFERACGIVRNLAKHANETMGEGNRLAGIPPLPIGELCSICDMVQAILPAAIDLKGPSSENIDKKKEVFHQLMISGGDAVCLDQEARPNGPCRECAVCSLRGVINMEYDVLKKLLFDLNPNEHLVEEQLGPLGVDMLKSLSGQDVTVHIDPKGGKWLDPEFSIPLDEQAAFVEGERLAGEGLSSIPPMFEGQRVICLRSDLSPEQLEEFRKAWYVMLDSVWVVGRINEDPKEYEGHTWNLIGVCLSEEIAVAACEDEYYFTGPVTMNKILPKELIEWPGVYHPKREGMKRVEERKKS